MTYTYPTFARALQRTWFDILLLGLFNVLFYILAFMRISMYDMR